MQYSSVDQPALKGKEIRNNLGKKQTRKNSSTMEKVLLASIVLLIFYGWYFKQEEIFSAELGWGYSLGIIGGSLMFILMLYPMRKHVKIMRNWGSISIWFRFHMLFGILGPTAILYHANFSFGSTNSNIALIAMLTVACSGLVGRFFYGKIHNGLYGEKTSQQDLQNDIKSFSKELIDKNNPFSSELLDQLEQSNKKYNKISESFLTSIFYLPLLSLSIHNRRTICKQLLKQYLKSQILASQTSTEHAKQIEKTFGDLIVKYLQASRKVFELKVYSKVFSFWHIFHLPLFLIMLITGIFHVYAVHMY